MGQELSSLVDSGFERSLFFIFVDIETMSAEAVPNPYVNTMGGAGIQTAQFIANKAVEIVFAGECGSNAFQTLRAAGVKLITGINGTVRETVEKFKSGQYEPAITPSAAAQFSTVHNMPYGNSGFGMRHGFNKGFGGKMDAESIPPSPKGPTESARLTPEQELQLLKEHADSIKQQIDVINKKIIGIEKKMSAEDGTNEGAA